MNIKPRKRGILTVALVRRILKDSGVKGGMFEVMRDE